MKTVKIINAIKLDKYPYCLNCGTMLRAQMITMVGNFYACPICGFDDYSKTIKEKNIQNNKIKTSYSFTVKKPLSDECFIYKDGFIYNDKTQNEG